MITMPTNVLKNTLTFLTPEEQVPLLFVCKMISALVQPQVKSLKAQNIIKMAARSDKADLTLWLNNFLPVEKYTFFFCREAASKGHLALLKLAKEKKWEIDTSTYNRAAEKGKIKVLRWLLKNGYPWNEFIINEAVSKGHFKTVEWLFRKGFPSSPSVCLCATGSLNMLKYLHQRGFELKEGTFLTAIHRGNLEVIEYLYKYRCPWNKYTWEAAIGARNKEVINFLRYNGCPGSKTEEE